MLASIKFITSVRSDLTTIKSLKDAIRHTDSMIISLLLSILSTDSAKMWTPG